MSELNKFRHRWNEDTALLTPPYWLRLGSIQQYNGAPSEKNVKSSLNELHKIFLCSSPGLVWPFSFFFHWPPQQCYKTSHIFLFMHFVLSTPEKKNHLCPCVVKGEWISNGEEWKKGEFFFLSLSFLGEKNPLVMSCARRTEQKKRGKRRMKEKNPAFFLSLRKSKWYLCPHHQYLHFYWFCSWIRSRKRR